MHLLYQYSAISSKHRNPWQIKHLHLPISTWQYTFLWCMQIYANEKLPLLSLRKYDCRFCGHRMSNILPRPPLCLCPTLIINIRNDILLQYFIFKSIICFLEGIGANPQKQFTRHWHDASLVKYRWKWANVWRGKGHMKKEQFRGDEKYRMKEF